MPAFPNLQGEYLRALVEFLVTGAEPPLKKDEATSRRETKEPVAASDAAKTNSPQGAGLYSAKCASCHGERREGKPPAFPPLVDVSSRLSSDQIHNRIRKGKGQMPSFSGLTDTDVDNLTTFLSTPPADLDPDHDAIYSSTPEGAPMKYRITGSRDFLDPDGYPAITPPWGTLNAIDLNTGKYLWKIPLGDYPKLEEQGLKNTGSENYGGPILTAGKVLFIGATVYDKKFRAFDRETGKLLWETVLPNAGVATPATYMIDGKQYVVISAGGGKDPKGSSGSTYVAFALR